MMGAHGVRAACGALVAIAALAAAVPALAHGGGSRDVRVSGQSLSTADPSVATLTGDLNGTWTTTQFDHTYDDQTGALVGWGAETFQGCLDKRRDGACGAKDPSGSMTFRFVYWAQLDPATGALIEGRCTHPVTGGDGAFAHASGVIRMHDRPRRDGSVVTRYTGKLVLQATPSSKRRAAPARAAAAAPPTMAAAC